MKIRHKLTVLVVATVVPLAAACSSTSTDTTSATTSTTAAAESTTDSSTDSTPAAGPDGEGFGGGGPGAVDVSAVSTEEQLIALIQEAYGDAGLDLHRGHQPVQDVLDEVLTISHDELHVRMDAGQNLAAVAEELGIDPQTLIDALVESWSPAIDTLLASGDITDAEAQQYREALEDAFGFRVTWDGEEATPTFSGLAA